MPFSSNAYPCAMYSPSILISIIYFTFLFNGNFERILPRILHIAPKMPNKITSGKTAKTLFPTHKKSAPDGVKIHPTRFLYLFHTGAAKSATVLPLKCHHLVKNKCRLVFHYAELTDTIIFVDHGIAQRICRHIPPVIRSTVRIIHHPGMIRLYDAKIFECAAARHNMPRIPQVAATPHRVGSW